MIKRFDITFLLGGGVLETALRETEVWMLDCLGFNLGFPLPQQFLRWARFAEPTMVRSFIQQGDLESALSNLTFAPRTAHSISVKIIASEN